MNLLNLAWECRLEKTASLLNILLSLPHSPNQHHKQPQSQHDTACPRHKSLRPCNLIKSKHYKSTEKTSYNHRRKCPCNGCDIILQTASHHKYCQRQPQGKSRRNTQVKNGIPSQSPPTQLIKSLEYADRLQSQKSVTLLHAAILPYTAVTNAAITAQDSSTAASLYQ